MLTELFAILAPIVICTALGFIWARTGNLYPAEFISRIVMNIGTPCLIVSVMARVEIEPAIMGGVALAALLAMAGMLVVGGLLIRWLKLEQATYLPPLVFPNNGNMGLPLCLFAFGETGLALALAAFMVMLLSTFTLGILMVSREQGGLLARFKALAQQPVIYAMLVASLMLVTDTDLPRWLGNTVDLLGGFAIPLMMLTLGVSLAQLKISGFKRSLGFSSLRIFGGLLLGWGAGLALGLEGVALGVVLLQSAMPVAVFNYLLALRYDRNPQEVAAMVIVSTAMAFVLLPLLLLLVLPWGGSVQ